MRVRWEPSIRFEILANVYRLMDGWLQGVETCIINCWRIFEAQSTLFSHFDNILPRSSYATEVGLSSRTGEDMVIELCCNEDPEALRALHARSRVHHLLARLIKFQLSCRDHMALQRVLGWYTELLLVSRRYNRLRILLLEVKVVECCRNGHQRGLLAIPLSISLLQFSNAILLFQEKNSIITHLFRCFALQVSAFLLKCRYCLLQVWKLTLKLCLNVEHPFSTLSFKLFFSWLRLEELFSEFLKFGLKFQIFLCNLLILKLLLRARIKVKVLLAQMNSCRERLFTLGLKGFQLFCEPFYLMSFTFAILYSLPRLSLLSNQLLLQLLYIGQVILLSLMHLLLILNHTLELIVL